VERVEFGSARHLIAVRLIFPDKATDRATLAGPHGPKNEKVPVPGGKNGKFGREAKKKLILHARVRVRIGGDLDSAGQKVSKAEETI
jgi:hypothetical protein